jgi:hypothetical protein
MKHYDTLDLEQFSKLPISRLAGEHAHLHLWTKNGFPVGDHYWAKSTIGIGQNRLLGKIDSNTCLTVSPEELFAIPYSTI